MTDNTQDTKEQCPPALRLTVIPFAGFYESIFSDLIESDLNRVLECPDNLNKEECDELANLVYDVQDFSALRDDTAKAYSESFSEWFKDETGFDLGLQFESMKSPREYNFTTDRIFCFIAPDIVDSLYRATDRKILADIVKERFTSRDGFASFYPNDLNQWIMAARPNAWDHNQVETLIIAKLKQHGIEDESLYGFDSPLYDRLQEKQSSNGAFDCLSNEYTAATSDPESVARMNALLDKERGQDQEQPKQEESENV